ncbi:hypothetical protein [Sorangium sp. So ce145]|uniref:hypothetical protein n=1 Tax=unclassified Sorangium TaxID=2621164 RepID=UPI003F5F18CC
MARRPPAVARSRELSRSRAPLPPSALAARALGAGVVSPALPPAPHPGRRPAPQPLAGAPEAANARADENLARLADFVRCLARGAEQVNLVFPEESPAVAERDRLSEALLPE